MFRRAKAGLTLVCGVAFMAWAKMTPHQEWAVDLYALFGYSVIFVCTVQAFFALIASDKKDGE